MIHVLDIVKFKMKIRTVRQIEFFLDSNLILYVTESLGEWM